MRLALAIFASALAASAQALPDLRIEPTAGGSILYVKNTAKAPLLAYLIELVDYPGSYYALWQDDTVSGPLDAGAERRIPITNMTVGAVPDYVKMRAALYADGTSAGIPERVAQLALRHEYLLETTRDLMRRVSTGATPGELKQWSESLQPQGKPPRYSQDAINQAAARPLIGDAAARLESSRESALAGLKTAERSLAERVRNDKIAVADVVIRPGLSTAGTLPVNPIREGLPTATLPAIVVYTNDGSANGAPVRRGDVVFTKSPIRNTGAADLHVVRAEFPTAGAADTWGAAGLAPNYKVLIENQYARVYDIRIPAGTNEEQHTHKARVVVCLSGAVLKHRMPDGREEESTLRTGEIVWRQGGTHIGQNLGKTDLRVIAIEPK